MNLVGHFPSDPCSGATVTAHALARELGRAGYNVQVERDVNPEAWQQAKLALVHLDQPDAVVAASREYQVPLVLLARNAAEARNVDPSLFALAVFPSVALAAQTRWRGPHVVVRPPVWVRDYQLTSRSDFCVTLVNVSAGSGATLLYTLAARMPDHRFLGVRGTVGAQIPPPDLPNLDVVGPHVDPANFYALTSILLMPGDQTYGRAAVEAACSGIPTIAHPSPGAQEGIGAGAIMIPRERIADWADAIRRLDNPAIYSNASRVAFRRAVTLDPTSPIREFVARIDQLCATRPVYTDPLYSR